MNYAHAVRDALKRLEASDTRQKRKNARKNLDRTLKALAEFVAETYPQIRKDGTEIMGRKVKGCRCPICNVPMKSFATLGRHLHSKHGSQGFNCFCGQRFGSNKALAGHLANKKCLKTHYGLSMLKQAATP